MNRLVVLLLSLLLALPVTLICRSSMAGPAASRQGISMEALPL